MKVIFATLFVGWLVSLSAFGQEKESNVADPFAAGSKDSALKNISVQLEYIEMSHKDLTRLLMERKPTSSDATALRMKVQEMVDKNVAKVMETKLVTSISGLKTSTLSKREAIYQTEFQFFGNGNNDTKEMKPADGLPVGSGNPVAFETRQVGISFQVEPTICENDKFIDVRFRSDFVW
jgi:hypothetical protein